MDDETLVAYVDGQLGGHEIEAVETALAGDPEARETVRALREGTGLLQAAFNDPMNESVPPRILETINHAANQTADQATPQGRAATPRVWHMALAASFAALVIGLGFSLYLTDQRVERQLAALEARLEADQRYREAELSKVLEKHVSGETVVWENPDSGSSGEITPVRTFKSSKGQWCREYSANAWLGENQEFQRAIACREAGGLWKTRLVLMTDS
jgi:hypothetical protein